LDVLIVLNHVHKLSSERSQQVLTNSTGFGLRLG
jgi:hypothetical protein